MLTPLVWTDGRLIDLDAIIPPLRASGAAIVVDAIQAAGVLPLDVGRLDVDYLVFPTYKWLLGPYTLAFLYVAPCRKDGSSLEHYAFNHEGGAAPFAGQAGPLILSARRFDMWQRFNPVSLRTPDGIAAGPVVAALAQHGVYVAERSGTVRVGTRIYNDEEDVTRFVVALGLASATLRGGTSSCASVQPTGLSTGVGPA